MIRTTGSGASDIGCQRQQNEDAFFVDDSLGLYLVADGMGGVKGGKEAADLCVSRTAEFFQTRRAELDGLRNDGKDDELAKLGEMALQEASRVIHERATRDSGTAGMGCASTLVLRGPKRVVMAHVGDSRLYLVRGEETHQMSADHTFAAELSRAGVLSPDQVSKHHLAHVLSRAIGPQESVLVDTLVFEVLDGDRLVLCTDGLSRYLEEPADLSARLADESIEGRSSALVAWANDAGGADNIAVIVVDVETEPGAEPIQARSAALESVFLFADLPLSQLNRILGVCEIIAVDAETTVLELGEPLDRLIVLLDGRLRVEGEEAHGDLEPGGHVGSGSLLKRGASAIQVTALERSLLLVLPGRAFRKLSRRRAHFGVDLLARLGRHLATALRKGRPSDVVE